MITSLYLFFPLHFSLSGHFLIRFFFRSQQRSSLFDQTYWYCCGLSGCLLPTFWTECPLMKLFVKGKALYQLISKCIYVRMFIKIIWVAILNSFCGFEDLLETRSYFQVENYSLHGTLQIFKAYSSAQLSSDSSEQAIIWMTSDKVFSELLKNVTKWTLPCTSFENRKWGKSCQTRSLLWKVQAVLVFF